VNCILYSGTRDEALLAAATANRKHDQSGLRRTNADKRRAVEFVLRNRGDWSDRRIADHVGVSHPLVASVRDAFNRRRQLEADTSSPSFDSPREGADGKSRRPKHLAPPGTRSSNPSPKPKNGRELISGQLRCRGIDSLLGQIIRGIDDLARDFGRLQTPEYKEMVRLQTELCETWKQFSESV
jgi:hypothetical protein